MIKAVIFDMDGVIVDSEAIHKIAEQKVMKNHGVYVEKKELMQFTGTTNEFVFSTLRKKYNVKGSVEDLVKEKNKIIYEIMEKEIASPEGVIDLIKDLKKNNFKLAVASGSSRVFIKFCLEKLEVIKYFDAIVGAEDVVYCKPDPEVFLKAAKFIGTDPKHCLVIEDAKNGVNGAKSAGMKVIGYRNENSGDQDLSNADLIIESFSELNVDRIKNFK